MLTKLVEFQRSTFHIIFQHLIALILLYEYKYKLKRQISINICFSQKQFDTIKQFVVKLDLNVPRHSLQHVHVNYYSLLRMKTIPIS